MTTTVISSSAPDRGIENSVRMLLPHTWLQAHRLLTRWRRDPMTVVQTLAYPVAMLVMLDVVLAGRSPRSQVTTRCTERFPWSR